MRAAAGSRGTRVWGGDWGERVAAADEAGTGQRKVQGIPTPTPTPTPLQKDAAARIASHFLHPRPRSPSPGSIHLSLLTSRPAAAPHGREERTRVAAFSAACASADRGAEDRLIAISDGQDEAETENPVFVGCVSLPRPRDI